MSPGEFSSGTGFEIPFEGPSLLFVCKTDGGFEDPGLVLGRVWVSAFVVFLQAGLQISGASRVVAG